MIDTELKIEFINQKDDVRPQRDGTMQRDRVYTFYLGKFGPFTERVPLDGFDENEIGRRVTALRARLVANQTL